eukprot:CAMPEP_0197567496 /NCGR_PEP_ID=MMETSP1320-20131121/35693_1 /TAXON_ID=91990 /ORGANISM="Bolidomonas sp., Strain RCC2347" /LENGTH=52 /DNA_ID=CAMNT_0043129687 /DNA_START=73 /DNA_END=231 /DNA_ORIENTATION=+
MFMFMLGVGIRERRRSPPGEEISMPQSFEVGPDFTSSEWYFRRVGEAISRKV